MRELLDWNSVTARMQLRPPSRFERPLAIALRRIVKTAKRIPCLDCGGRDSLSFDHIPWKGKKRYGIGGVGNVVLITRRQLFAELRRCEVVCRACHDFREFERRWARDTKFRMVCYRRKRSAVLIMVQVFRIFRALTPAQKSTGSRLREPVRTFPSQTEACTARS